MHNNFYRERISGAPASQNNQRRVIAGPRSSQGTGTFKAEFFGIPNKDHQDRKKIKDIDPLCRIPIMPMIQPLQLTFTATNKFRDKLLENLGNWRINSKASMIFGAVEPTFCLRFDNVGSFLAALKIGNAFIAQSDAMYHFRGEPIFLTKTILTKETKMVHYSAFSEPGVEEKFKAKFNRALNVLPAFRRISEYNQEMSRIAEHNMWRVEAKIQPMQELPLPTDEPAFSVQENFHGEPGCLSAWLNTLITHDHFLKEFENEKEELKKRLKRDENKLAPPGATMCLGSSKLRLEETGNSIRAPNAAAVRQESQENQNSLRQYQNPSQLSSNNSSGFEPLQENPAPQPIIQNYPPPQPNIQNHPAPQPDIQNHQNIQNIQQNPNAVYQIPHRRQSEQNTPKTPPRHSKDRASTPHGHPLLESEPSFGGLSIITSGPNYTPPRHALKRTKSQLRRKAYKARNTGTPLKFAGLDSSSEGSRMETDEDPNNARQEEKSENGEKDENSEKAEENDKNEESVSDEHDTVEEVKPAEKSSENKKDPPQENEQEEEVRNLVGDENDQKTEMNEPEEAEEVQVQSQREENQVAKDSLSIS